MALGLGGSTKFVGSPLIFVQWLKLATSTLAHRWSFTRPIINHTRTRKWAWSPTSELPKLRGSPLIFLQWLKLANSNLVYSLCLPRPIIQEAPLTLRGQRRRCRNIKWEPQIYGSFPSPKTRPLFLWVRFYGGTWETQAVYQT